MTPDIGVFACRRWFGRVGGALASGSSFACGSCRHCRGGPCHFVTISGSGSLEFAGWLAHRSAQGRRHPQLGPQAAGRRRECLTARLWAPVALSPPLHGGNVVRVLLAPHEYTPGAARRSRVQQAPGSLLEPTASLVAPHPKGRRPSPLTRVSATLSPECQQPCHSRSAPVVPTGGGVPETCPDRREQGGWQRDNTLLTGSGCMIGACNVSNR